MMNASHVRREVYFQGRVQGVGFRQTTAEIAERFHVVGFVQNLPDGRVLLTAEGEPGELDRFVAGILAEMARNVTGHTSDEFPARGEFDDFSIHH